MSEDIKTPEQSEGVKEEPTQEQAEQEQEKEKIFLPIFVKKFDNYDFDYEIVEIALDNMVIKNMNITLDGIIYKIEVNLKLKDLLHIFRNINSKKDYVETIEKISPGLMDVDKLIRSSYEDDP